MTTSARPLTLLKMALLAAPLLLAACTSLGPGITVTETGTTNAAPDSGVPQGADPEDSVIGRREHPRIIAAYGGVYSDREAEVMLAGVVTRLLRAANQSNTAITVTILDSAEVNAFALPGGFVYVTRGMLALANDTSELAAVLAHEISHVTLRHARARQNRQRTTEIVDSVIGLFGGDASTDQASNRSKLSLAAFSQNQELAADREGIKIAGQAGYDPHAAARFLGDMARFATFSAGDRANGDDFLGSHPATPERIAKAEDSARAFFGDAEGGDTARDAYLTAIDGVVFGDSPQQGAIVGNRFIHPNAKLTFTVPQGYALQNSQNAVVGVAGDGEAVRFDSAEVSSSTSLTDYLKSGWIAGLRPDSVKTMRYNDVDIATGLAQTADWAFRVAVMRFDGTVYRFIFAAKTDSAAFAKSADDTLRSFRRAETREIANIETSRLDIVTARPGDTAASLARRMNDLPRGTDLFYVLNNLYPGDPITPGTRYKVVVTN
jgi:predicted Zn-dependent protease